jgi:type IV secretory pathway TraG/TraD family ATPase VirD4
MWRTLGQTSATVARAAAATSRGVTGAAQNLGLQRGRRAANRGLLPPGAPPPPPDVADFYDYRGVATPSDVAALQTGVHRLGEAVDLRTGRGTRIGLTREVLQRHAAIVGPSGVGKTGMLLVPWALSTLAQGDSVVMVDVAGDLLEQIQSAGAQLGGIPGRVAKWDLTDPGRSMSWNWLSEMGTPDAVTAAVEALVGRERVNDPQPYFGQRDRRILEGLIQSALDTTGSVTAQQLLAFARSQDALRGLASRAPRSGPRLSEATQADSWEYGKIMSGVVNALDVFEHPGLAAITSHDRFRLPMLFDEPSLLIIGAPLHAARVGVSASSLMSALLIRELYKGFGQQRRRVVTIFDEAARLKDRINFEEFSSVSRRAGVSIVLATQFAEQFDDENQRNAILGNCSTFIQFSTVSKPSAAFFASRLGSRRQTTVGRSDQISTWHTPGGRQWTHSLEDVPVLGDREIQDQPWADYSALVHCPQVTALPIPVDLAAGL